MAAASRPCRRDGRGARRLMLSRQADCLGTCWPGMAAKTSDIWQLAACPGPVLLQRRLRRTDRCVGNAGRSPIGAIL